MTIADALREFEARGYVGQFGIREEGRVECNACGHHLEAARVGLDGTRRIEGVSDPADMVFVGALRCPDCGNRGTAVIPYGPGSTPESAKTLRALEASRHETLRQHAGEVDPSVRDTGWLEGPDGA